MNEFDLIKHYFNKRSLRSDILQSIGDDCAVTTIDSTIHNLVITTDTLVCNSHFLPTISPEDLAYKAVAVNLSDLAAMGATPAWVSLALTLPSVEHQWLEAFSTSFFDALAQYNVALIGGDTTKGNLAITITAQGLLKQKSGLYRHKANIGDLIYVSGTLGDSAMGLNLLLTHSKVKSKSQEFLLQRHLRPIPRIELGKLLTQYSQCAIDISDGLLADLNHILERSQCGAVIFLDKLPLSQELLANVTREQAENLALTGGEDYELCFTISPDKQNEFEQAIQHLNLPCTCIGYISEQSFTLYKQNKPIPFPQQMGFDHFTS